MNVIVSSRERLRARYGSTGLGAVERALDDLVAARATAGIESLRYMIEEGVAQLGVVGAAVEWQAIAAQLGAVADGLLARGTRLESVLLVGGPQIVPFGVLANPVPDRDSSLPVDCVYGAATPSSLSTDMERLTASAYGIDWPVGRLPDADEPSPVLLVATLQAAAAQHRRGPLRLLPALCYSTASWQAASARVCDEIRALTDDASLEFIVSPPATPAQFDRAAFARARLIYCNLHGLLDAPFWYGQSADDMLSLVPAVRPQDLADLDLSGSVVLSASCYGAAVRHETLAQSMALMALSRHAAAFIGATVITYGPLRPPSSEADLLMLHILRMIYGRARTIGEAFLGGRVGMLREQVLQHGYLDDDDAKTLLGFVFYGDPTMRIGHRQLRRPTSGRVAGGG